MSTLLQQRTDGGLTRLLVMVIAVGGCSTGGVSGTPVGEQESELESCESVEFEIPEGEGFASPDEALEQQGNDIRFPVGDFVVEEAETDRHVWEIVDASGRVIGEVRADLVSGGWWLSRAEWCFDPSPSDE